MNEIFHLLVDQKEFFIGLLLEHIQISLSVIMLAIVIGMFIGIVISEYKKLSNSVLAIINFLYTIPSISMLGFLIPLSGIGNNTAIITLLIYAMLPIVSNTYKGIIQVDSKIIEAATGMGSTKFQLLYKIKLPLALPSIVTGVRNMSVMTITLTGVASFIGAGGLGVAIYRGITTNNSSMTFIGSFLIAILALVVDYFLSRFEFSLSSKNKKPFKLKYILLVCVFLLGSLFVLDRDDYDIHIASKPMSEQYILSNMLSILIEDYSDLKVNITQGVGGGTSNIHPAMLKGEFDIYFEYTGTAWNAVLGNTNQYYEEQFDYMSDLYYKNYDMSWSSMFGFNNTYGIAVRKDIADKYDLKTYSDLSKVSDQLVFGGEYDFFGRLDGFDELCNTYNLLFKSTKDMDIGLKYQAIEQGQIDVMNIFTTDGLLSSVDIVVLEDDKSMYPSYLCGSIVRNDILDQYPQLIDILELLENKISDVDISKMNYQVESLGIDPYKVAYDFLVEVELIR